MCLIDMNMSRNAKIRETVNPDASKPMLVPANPDRIALYAIGDDGVTVLNISLPVSHFGQAGYFGGIPSLGGTNSMTVHSHPGIVSSSVQILIGQGQLLGYIEVILDATMSNAVQNVFKLA